MVGFDSQPRAVFSPVRAGNFSDNGIAMPFLQVNLLPFTGGSWPFIDHCV